MSGITLVIAEEKLALWLDALDALATSQSVTVEENDSRRVVTRANLSEVQSHIKFWNDWCQKLRTTRKRGGYIVR